jgi:AcrR family transcriptional regulator
MARKATKPASAKPRKLSTAEEMPEWKQQSVNRSLSAARMRAQERTDRFVATTIELMQANGSTDFTVQDVVDRSRMSIRTFYNFFASKDDLLVAVHETILASDVVTGLRKKCEAERDPILRIRAYVEGMFEMASRDEPVSRALTTYYNRLAETRPEALERAFKPQIDLVMELVQDAQNSGRLQSVLSVEKATHLLHHTVRAAVHAHILGSESSQDISAESLWQFCSHGLGVQPAKSKSRS